MAADPLNRPGLGQFGYIGSYRIPIQGIDGVDLVEAKQIVTRNIDYPPAWMNEWEQPGIPQDHLIPPNHPTQIIDAAASMICADKSWSCSAVHTPGVCGFGCFKA